MTTKVVMPEMGEGVIEGTVGRWLKEEGEHVDQYEPLLEIETDKVTTEATAETTGMLLKIVVDEGDTVDVGTILAYIGEPGESIDGEAADETEVIETGATQPEPVAAQAAGKSSNGGIPAATSEQPPAREGPYTGRISPVVARIAEEHSVDLNQVPGTGRNGRITKRDIMNYIEQREAEPEPVPAVETEETAVAKLQPEERQEPTPVARPKTAAPDAVPGEIVQLSNMRRAIAEHMVESKHTSPHVTTVHEVDFSAVIAHRDAHKQQFAEAGIKLTFTPYIAAAVVKALQAHPMVNSSWTDEGVLVKKEINVGMATAIDSGLIVPVIKNADELSLRGLARAVNDLAERARNNQLKPNEVKGGTFSITNHGVFGSLFATPIINQPQCGILGVGAIEKRVKVTDGDAIVIRPCAYVSFTFDHRILDGASGDAFANSVKEALENWQ